MKIYLLILSFFVHTLCFGQQQVYDKIQSLLGDGKYEECEHYMLDNRDKIITNYGKLIYDMNLVVSIYNQFIFSHDTLKLVHNKKTIDSFWDSIKNYDVNYNGANLWPLINMSADYFHCLNDIKCLDVYNYAKRYQKGETQNDSIFFEIQKIIYDYYLKSKDYEKAEEICNSMMDSLKSNKDLSYRLPVVYHQMAKVLHLKRNYTKAQYYYELSWQKQFESSSHEYNLDYPGLLRDLASFYYENGNSERWYYFANRYCKFTNSLNNDSLYIASLIDLCKSEIYINKIDSAINHLELVNQILKKKSGLSRLRNLSHMMTNLLDKRNNRKQSLKYHIEKPKAFEKDYYQYIAELAALDEDYNKAIDIMSSLKNHFEKTDNFLINEYIETCCQLSTIFSTLGKLAEAEKVLVSSEDFIAGKGIITTLTRNLYFSHGIIRFNLKDYEESLKFFKKAKKLYEISNDKGLLYAETLSSISSIYLEKGDLFLSKIYIEEATELFMQDGFSRTPNQISLSLMQNLAYLNNTLDNTNEAKKLWEEILFNDENKKFSSVYSLAANNYGMLCFQKHNFTEAERWFKNAIYLCNNDNNKETFLQNIIAAKYFTGETDIEYDLLSYNQLVNNNVANIFTNFTETEREEFWDYQARTAVTLNNLIASKTYNNSVIISAFNANIHAKTLLLNASRVIKDLAIHSKNRSVVENYNKLLYYKTLISDKKTSIDSIRVLKEQINKTEKDVLLAIPDLADKINNQCSTYDQIKESLKDKEVALEFATLVEPDLITNNWRSHYIAYLINKNEEAPKLIVLCSEDSLYKITDRYGLNNETLVNNIYRDDNLDIYNLVWRNIEDFIPKGTRVYFAPTGILNTINFNAIPSRNGRLGEIYEFVEVSTTGRIPNMNIELSDTYRDALIYGDINYDTEIDVMKEQSSKYKLISSGYLPMTRSIESRGKWGHLYGTAIEALAIDSILKIHDVKTRLLKNNEANEESFKALDNKSPHILHVATHGFYLSNPQTREKKSVLSNVTFTKKDQPLLYSGLLFSGANKAWVSNIHISNTEDGILTADEISRLELSNTKIAVMSACETGLGAIDDIDGVFGLQRGLKKAGVNSIVMSLWTVPDMATCLLMEQFYNNLFSGQNRHIALKNAQREVMKVYQKPYFWAGFVIID